VFYVPADRLNDTCDFVAERKWQWMDARYSGPIMRIRMTDPGGLDPHQHIIIARVRQWDII
jgi:hypothetical protein